MALRIDAKKVLAESLEELLEARELKDVTVQDIVDNCGAARSTFYHHFKDKYDLANWVYSDFLTRYMDLYQPFDIDDYTIQLKPLEFVYSKKQFFKKLFRYKEQNSFYEYVYDITNQRAMEMYRLIFGTKEMPKEILFAIDYMSAGNANAIKRWVENDFYMEPAEMAKCLLDNTSPVLADIHEGWRKLQKVNKIT